MIRAPHTNLANLANKKVTTPTIFFLFFLFFPWEVHKATKNIPKRVGLKVLTYANALPIEDIVAHGNTILQW